MRATEADGGNWRGWLPFPVASSRCAFPKRRPHRPCDANGSVRIEDTAVAVIAMATASAISRLAAAAAATHGPSSFGGNGEFVHRADGSERFLITHYDSTDLLPNPLEHGRQLESSALLQLILPAAHARAVAAARHVEEPPEVVRHLYVHRGR